MILAIDIGGTAVKMCLSDRLGNIHRRHEASVCFDQYQTPILETVLKEAEAFLKREGASIEAVGVSATGQVDDRAGMVIGTNGKIPHYEGSCIKEACEKRFSVPAFVLNDANAAALGECFIGRGKGYEHVLMVTLGTGVGGGIVLNGHLFGGARGIAGELGHFTLYQDGLPCTCGKKGCFENYAATTALVRLAEETTGENALNGRIIFERAKDGDKEMLQVLDHWIGDIAGGITGLIHIFNPQLVLIGGGVSSQEELLMMPLRKRIKAGIMPRFSECLQVESAILGNDAGMIGAVKFCLDQMEGSV